ncbi:HAD-IIA family hydrolase [Nocardioides panacisoli]|uniref:HAD-IIA family hydrolase n=1 Tax=Nocardioides panacisoli TaxID=627624 RepID=UPI001C638066|nr:HAD-IIA family hydrolase [Nocardioides panacisoli]QYJ05147.1 HAD-IIA family hydrolase [Nocardioides panacisoli]
MFTTTDGPLAERYDVALLDLDGVVYVGGEAVPGAPAHLADAAGHGMRLSYVTNNASRPPERVARHLTELGVDAGPADVVTSAQAAARVLRERVGASARVVALGGEGLVAALAEAGLEPVGVDDDAAAVATGYGPDVRWRDIMHVAVRVRDGLPWVASNTDHTIPTAFGVAPGHGVLVDAVSRFAGIAPTVAGKPAPPLLQETIRRTSAERPLMIGDRLDTDIEGAHRVGIDSLLVLTGVTGLAELVAAAPEQRPHHLAPDLAGLLERHVAPEPTGDGYDLAGWQGRVRDGVLRVAGEGTTADWWRVAAATAWDHRDRHGAPPDIRDLAVPSATSRAG